MGSSMRKKKEKAKDFKKQKLKVGKAKVKPDNFTDTSFKSKSIVLNQQSLKISAPSSSSQFNHYLSLASTSKTDTQRRDALSYLTTQMSTLPANHSLPLPTAVLLPKLMPLILDGSSSVRSQLLKLLRLLPSSDVADHIECALLYTRAGITHLALEIRIHALESLELLLEVAGDQVVGCPGGWVKTLKCLMSIMGWNIVLQTGKWSSATKVSLGWAGKTFPRQLLVFSHFLNVGLVESDESVALAAQQRHDDLARNIKTFPLVDVHLNMIPTAPDVYAYLNLFGAPRDEENEIYSDREARLRVFQAMFLPGVRNGIENAKKEGGEVGRAAGVLADTLKRGVGDCTI